MGVVHHANYLVWFELDAPNTVKQKVFPTVRWKEDNALMVVAEVYCRYKSPAFYDDSLVVRTKLEEVRSRTIRFLYEVYRPSDQTLLVEGETMHIVPTITRKFALCRKIQRNVG